MSQSPEAFKVTVGLTAVKLFTVEGDAAARGDGRITYEILNNSNHTIWLGGTNTVTNANGSPLPRGGARTIDLRLGAEIWAISLHTNQDVRVLKIN